MSLVKICGLNTPASLEAALAAGADMIGLVRFARSPRHVELDAGRALARQAAGRAQRVLLLVDPTDAELDEAVGAIEPDMLQLHGAESPARVATIRARTGRPVMKAIAIGTATDLNGLDAYRGAADRILLDAKPPKGSALPGGNGVAFDWTLLAGLARPSLCTSLGMGAPNFDPDRDIMLSGGLTPENVADAIQVSRLRAVDVSSGVERAPGVKDNGKIAALVEAARAAFAASDCNRRVA